MMLSARSRSPFTVSQWQELEHQALIFKYMVSGVPIPPDLICTVKRSLDSSMSARLFPHQPVGWGCYQVGFGRKADLEPGRCRRTDGKKWRCSKEAFPDSKYCERHMHRGKNRSRKPVEAFTTTTTNPSSSPPISSITINSSTTTSSSSSYSPYSISSSMASDQTQLSPHHSYHNTPLYPFLYPHSSSSRPPGSGLLSPQNNTTHHLFLDSAAYSQADKDYRYFHGMREGVDERTFFPEASGTVRGLSESYTPLTMSHSTSGYSQSHFQGLAGSSKQQQQQQQEQHCFVLGTDFKSARSTKAERDDDETQKPLHHFFSEWPQKNRDSWLDLEDDPSTHSSFSTTQLSISLPMSSHELHSSNPRIRTDG